MLATLIKALEFNVDGVLPSAESDIEFFPDQETEPQVYSVDGGLLKQETFDHDGNFSYLYPNTQLSGGDIDPALGITMDARLRINQIDSTGITPFGAYFALNDGVNEYGAFFTEAGIDVRTSTGDVSLSFDHSDFHSYRVTSPGNSNQIKLYADGQLLFSGEALADTHNGFGWGDGRTPAGNGADVDWDYIRVYQGDPPPPTTTTLVKALEFNVDGVLPSADSQIEYFTTSTMAESDIYTVQNGVLRQQTVGIDGKGDYRFPDSTLMSGGLASTHGTTIDFRLNLLDVDIDLSGSPPFNSAFIQAWDGAHHYHASFVEDGIYMQAETGADFVPFLHSGFHNYRLASPANSGEVSLYIDGNLLHTTTGSSNTTENGFNFGQGRDGPEYGSDVDWDYVRVYQGDPPPPTSTTLVKALEFNVDGVLPSVDPDIELDNNTGAAENGLYSVTEGVLRQRTKETDGAAEYRYPNIANQGGDINASLPLVVDVRLNVLDIETTGPGTDEYGTYFDILDGLYSYAPHFVEGGIRFRVASGSEEYISFDHSGFHEYRLTSPANSNQANLYIDGELQHSWNARHDNTHNGIAFGDGRTAPGNGADVDWDYIRVYQGDPPPFPQSPSLTEHQLYETLAKGFVYNAHTEGASVGFGTDYIVDREFGANSATGFYALGLISDTEAPLLVFRGTDFTSVLDWDSNADAVGVGYSQFIEARDDDEGIFNWLDEQSSPASLVGHSLGGALAQWAAAEYTALGASNLLGDIVTFNAPGIADSLPDLTQFGADEFVARQAGDVHHYVTNGDVVSMAGRAFLDGEWTFSTFVGSMFDKHLKPVVVDQYTAANGSVRVKPLLVSLDFDDVDWLNNPFFVFPDIPYHQWTSAISTAGIAAGVPSLLTFRATTETSRQVIGGLLEEFLDVEPHIGNFSLKLPRVDFLRDSLLFDFEDASLNYDGSLPIQPLRIQGNIRVPALANLSAELSGDNYFEISHDGIDVVGEFSFEDVLPFSKWIGLQLEELTLTVDTTQQSYSARGELNLPILRGNLLADVEIIEGQISRIVVGADDLNIPIGTTSLFLQRIEGGLSHFAENDPNPLTIEAGVGISALATVELDLPNFLGGDFEAALASLDIDASINRERINGEMELNVLSATVLGEDWFLIKANGDGELDFNSGGLSVEGAFDILNGFVTGTSHFSADADLNVLTSGNGQAQVPADVPFIGGQFLADASYLIDFSNDNNLSNDSATIWGDFDLPFIGEGSLGVRFVLDSAIPEILGGEEITALEIPSAASNEDIAALTVNVGDIVEYDIAGDTPWILLTANWETPSSNVEIELRTPSGQLVAESDLALLSDVELITQFQSDTRRVVVINNPEPGKWQASIESTDAIGGVDHHAIGGTDIPTVAVLSIAGGVASPVEIGYEAFDADSQATVTIFYDNDNQGFDGIPIDSGLIEADGIGNLTWVPQFVDPGDYFIYAIVDDGENAPVFSYANSPVTIKPITGDYDRNGTVEQADYVIWQSSFGMTVSPGVGADGNADGIVDAADYTVWRNNLGATIVPPQVLPGDYDRNGTVEEADYTLWQTTFGQSVVAGSGADGNADGIVGIADYTVWRDNLGATAGAGALASAATVAVVEEGELQPAALSSPLRFLDLTPNSHETRSELFSEFQDAQDEQDQLLALLVESRLDRVTNESASPLASQQLHESDELVSIDNLFASLDEDIFDRWSLASA